MFVYMHMNAHVCMPVYVAVCVHTCVWLEAQAYICIFACMSYMYVCMWGSMCKRIGVVLTFSLKLSITIHGIKQLLSRHCWS